MLERAQQLKDRAESFKFSITLAAGAEIVAILRGLAVLVCDLVEVVEKR